MELFYKTVSVLEQRVVDMPRPALLGLCQEVFPSGAEAEYKRFSEMPPLDLFELVLSEEPKQVRVAIGFLGKGLGEFMNGHLRTPIIDALSRMPVYERNGYLDQLTGILYGGDKMPPVWRGDQVLVDVLKMVSGLLMDVRSPTYLLSSWVAGLPVGLPLASPSLPLLGI